MILKAVGVVVLAGPMLTGLWFGGWWVQRQVVQKSAEIREDTFARQTALQQEVLTLSDDVATIAAYAVYWEGFVQTVAGPVEFADGTVKLVGPPSFDFSE